MLGTFKQNWKFLLFEKYTHLIKLNGIHLIYLQFMNITSVIQLHAYPNILFHIQTVCAEIIHKYANFGFLNCKNRYNYKSLLVFEHCLIYILITFRVFFFVHSNGSQEWTEMCEKLAGQVLRWAKEKVFWQPTHIPIFYMLHNARKMECGAIIKSQYRQTAERPNNILSVPYKLLLKVVLGVSMWKNWSKKPVV